MSNVGVKIQARNEYFINPTIPTRDTIRKANYDRRLAQLNSEGFFSKLWKPYICIGHPLELDKDLEISVIPQEKKIIESKLEKDIKPKFDEVLLEGEVCRNNEVTQNSKKTTEKLEQLNKSVKEEIKKSELVSFNVRSGHSFFDIIQKEQEEKIASAAEAKRLQQLRNTTEIRPPPEESDSDSEFPCNISEDKDTISRPSTAVSKKKCPSRPFTPMYNNINSLPNRSTGHRNSTYSCQSGDRNSSTSDEIKQESIYRQLASLHWLLEAMIQENVENMARISLSWIVRNENNNLTSAKSRKEIRTVWDKYVSKYESHSTSPKNKGRISITFQSQNPNCIQQISKSKENDNTERLKEEIDTDLIKFSKSPTTNFSKAGRDSFNSVIRSSQSASSLKRRQMLARVRSVCEDIDKDNDDYEYRKNLHLLRIGRCPVENKRISESTKLQPEDQFSEKLKLMLLKHRESTNQIIDERMTGLRENVRNMTEYKMTICLNKFKDIQTKGAFHQMLKNFRGKNTYQNFFAALDKSKNKIVYTDWFLSLEEALKDYMSNKRIAVALENIRQYALITITKLNKNRLLSVLKHLSDWEIRHPDVSASIKFITDHVVIMTEEEYQQWFDKNV